MSGNSGPVINKINLVEYSGILEEPFFQGNDEELGRREVLSYHDSNILRVRQIQCRIYLVKDVEGSRLVLEKSKDQREG